MKKVYLLLAEGFETIEALTPLDVLRRCGVELITVSISDSLEVVSAQNLKVKADILFEDIKEDADMVILPGGCPGFINLRESEKVIKMVQDYAQKGKYVAAICGAPTVLSVANLYGGANIAAHPSVVEELVAAGYDCTGADVEVAGKLITGKGAGLSLPFALTLAKALVSEDIVAEVEEGLF